MQKLLWTLLLLVGSMAVQGQIVISEFIAGGNTVLQDEDGQYSDWIEIYNPSDLAVNLDGWLLTDKADNLAKWSFPATNISAHGFLTVFASSKNRRVAGKPLHTNFKLNSAGEYLALTQPGGLIKASEFAPYPKQYPGISYGTGHTKTLVAANASAKVLIPTSDTLGSQWTSTNFNDASWVSGTNGVGYETTLPGFASRVYQAIGGFGVSGLDVAEEVIATPGLQAIVTAENTPTINFMNTGGGANFGNDQTFPGLIIDSDADNFVLEATATITIPSAGNWTFGVNSDDGFGLTIGDFSMSYPSPRGPDNTISTFNFPAAGDYPLRLVYYEQGGGSSVEMWAAKGSFAPWEWSSDYQLVGDTANGGLKVTSQPVGGSNQTGYGSSIHTDVKSSMLGQQVSAYVRIPFQATQVATIEALRLNVRFDDGFVAYLNGIPVARRNAPSSPAWNTPATAVHEGNPAEMIDLSDFRQYLQEGNNVLAIHGMNISSDDMDFLIQAELVGYSLGDKSYNYMAPPTPSAPNGTSYPALAEAVKFSLPGGVFGTNVVVALSTPTAGATIRYTLDNSTPNENSTLYQNPFTLNTSASIRARAFATGLLPSEPSVEVYTLLDIDLLNFNSNLPLIILNTYGKDIQPDMPERVAASVTVINTSTNTGTAYLLDHPDFHGQAGIEGRGQTSWGFDKKPYNMSFRTKDGQDKNVSVLGMPEGADWVLLNIWNDKTLMNDFMAHELFEKMGHYAVRRHYVEVFLNGSHPDNVDSSGKVGYEDYIGIYLLLEKIQIADHRVNIAKLSPTDNTEPNISGGYIFTKDKDSPGDVNFTTLHGENLKFHDPKGEDLTQVQQNWLVNYINQFERALYGSQWTNANTGYEKYIDVDSFVDYHWIVEFSKQIDGYRLSNYMQKDRNGKIKMEPIWDWNLSFGNADYNDGESPENWYYSQISLNDHIWLSQLVDSPGDPDFNQKIADRWSVLRTNVFAVTNVLGRMDELTIYLQQAQARDFTRWPRLDDTMWPNPPGLGSANSHQKAVNYVKNWITQRFAWIDSQYLLSPSLDRAEGPIIASDLVNISAPQGTIYYTLNGADPRLAGGKISPSAIQYKTPIVLNNNARIFARAYYNKTWSGPAAASFYTHIPTLAITEIMYHPLASGTNSADDFQYLELMNTGTNTLNLAGIHFTHGIEFAFTQSSLLPNQRLLLVQNRDAFQSRYGNNLNIGGVFTNTLAHGGERLTLVGALGEPILDFVYDDKWDALTDGQGYSLIVANEYAPFADWSKATQWTRSAAVGGSPGQIESLGILSAIYLESPGSAVKIRFNAPANKTCRIQYSDSITAANWQTLTEIPSQAQPQVVEISDPVTSGHSARYYRIQAN